jgi:uncharacterized protein Yka (UPF0111/DUF47 family)
VVKSVETIVIAARSFFRDPRTVRDHIYKVRVYESESDKIALRLKKNIFDSQLPLERKIQLRDSVNVINSLADASEDAARSFPGCSAGFERPASGMVSLADSGWHG